MSGDSLESATYRLVRAPNKPKLIDAHVYGGDHTLPLLSKVPHVVSLG